MVSVNGLVRSIGWLVHVIIAVEYTLIAFAADVEIVWMLFAGRLYSVDGVVSVLICGYAVLVLAWYLPRLQRMCSEAAIDERHDGGV